MGIRVGAVLALAMLGMGCAAPRPMSTTIVGSFTLHLVEREQLDQMTKILGIPRARGLWINSSRQMWVEYDDWYALGHEVGHAAGLIPLGE